MGKLFSRAIMAAAALGLAAPGGAQSVKAGIEAYGRGDYAAALGQWRPLAARGNADAMFNLGQAYRLGRGIPIDLGAAEDWYTDAARLGHVDAQTQLGMMLFQNGYPRAAMSWLRKAADKGEARAQLVYGTALYNGDGVEKRDPLLAYSYVAKSAAQGLGPAKTALAEMEREIPEHLRKIAVTGGPQKIAAATPSPQIAKPSPPAIAAKTRPSAPPSPPKLAATGAWRVQLGAFAQRGAAEALFRKLAAGPLAGRQPFLTPVGGVTRLQAGPFASREEAGHICTLLTARGQPCFAVPAR
jgi:TPR repeat protein